VGGTAGGWSADFTVLLATDAAARSRLLQSEKRPLWGRFGALLGYNSELVGRTEPRIAFVGKMTNFASVKTVC